MSLTFLIGIAVAIIVIHLSFGRRARIAERSKGIPSIDVQQVVHFKKEALITANQLKLLNTLRKVLGNDYMIHCQTSFIALVEPIESEQKARARNKRTDFVISDLDTNILAVVELDEDDDANFEEKLNDAYINAALEPHHPLIRIPSSRFYHPSHIKKLLEKHTEIEFNEPAVA